MSRDEFEKVLHEYTSEILDSPIGRFLRKEEPIFLQDTRFDDTKPPFLKYGLTEEEALEKLKLKISYIDEYFTPLKI